MTMNFLLKEQAISPRRLGGLSKRLDEHEK